MLEATRIRLISDVPLGAFLSGGTDSSTIVALMARASSGPVKTFSIGFAKDDFNESDYARIVARKFATDHHEMILEPDVVQTVEHLTSSLEEPFGDSSMLPTYYVSQMARRHVTVALSGDGGDEIFAGYDRYRVHADRRIFEHVPTWARQFYRKQMFPLVPRKMKGRLFSYNLSLPWRERYVDSLSFVPGFERDTVLLSDDFRQMLRSGDDPQNALLRHFAKGLAQDPVSELLYVDTKTYMVGDILTKVDRMSMLNSLEVRVPDPGSPVSRVGYQPSRGVEAAREYSEIHPAKTGAARWRASRSSRPPEAGIRASPCALDAQRIERSTDDSARAAHVATWIFPDGRGSQADE